MHCPRCQGTRLVKNGTIHNGKPKWKCKECGRQFVINSAQHHISDQTKQLIDKRARALPPELVQLSDLMHVN